MVSDSHDAFLQYKYFDSKELLFLFGQDGLSKTNSKSSLCISTNRSPILVNGEAIRWFNRFLDKQHGLIGLTNENYFLLIGVTDNFSKHGSSCSSQWKGPFECLKVRQKGRPRS